MDAYRISETDADLPSLIDRVAAGEQVLITRKGQTVAELCSVSVAKPPSQTAPRHITPEAQEAWRRLAELRDSLPPLTVSSVELINDMREEREEAIAGLHRR